MINPEDDFKQQFQDLVKIVEDQQKTIEGLKTKRLYQMDFTPGCVKNAAMGEPNSYIYSGLASKRPTTGVKLSTTGSGCSVYFETDTGKLRIWNGISWLSVTLT